MAPRGDPAPVPAPGERLRLVAWSCHPDRIEARRVRSARLLAVQRRRGHPPPVEGESFLLRVSETWTVGARRWLAGEISAAGLDVAALDLEPLTLVELGGWDPRQDQLSGLAPGPPSRQEYEIERIPAETAAAATAGSPFHRAIDLWAEGDVAAARAALAGLLRRDLRCLAAHACLGFFAFNEPPPDGGTARALRHYEVGLAIAGLSMPRGFRGVLPWSRPGNRAFLRCLYGRSICLWRLGDLAAARDGLLRVCELNPGDQLAARLALDRIENGTA